MKPRTVISYGASLTAFSLLELVLVVAIIAVLSAIALPRYARAVTRYRVQLAGNRIANDLGVARERARSLGASQSVSFDPAGDTYQIPGLESMDGSGGTYTVNLSDKPYKATLVSANFGGSTTVTFDGYGVPDNGGTIVVQIGSVAKTIVLDSSLAKATVQ